MSVGYRDTYKSRYEPAEMLAPGEESSTNLTVCWLQSSNEVFAWLQKQAQVLISTHRDVPEMGYIYESPRM